MNNEEKFECTKGHEFTMDEIDEIGRETGTTVLNDIAYYECPKCKGVIKVPLNNT